MIGREEKIDKRLSNSIVAFFVIQSLNAVVKTVGTFPMSFQGIISLISGAGIMLFLLSGLLFAIRRSAAVMIMSLIFFIFAYSISIFLSMFIRNEPIDLLIHDSALWTFAFWIPIGVYTYSIKDYRILYKAFYEGSFIIGILMCITFIWFIIVGVSSDATEYNMFFSYTLILPLLIHINEYIERKKVWIGLLAILELFAIVMYGSRGAVLCLIAYLILKLFTAQMSLGKSLFYLITILCIVILGYELYINQEIFESIGLHSRLLSKIELGEATSGRNYVWKAGLIMVSEKPILGYGIGGEYYGMTRLCERFTGIYVDEVSSLSPHNGIIQLMLNFGVPIGLSISLWIILSILKLKNYKDPIVIDLFIIMFSSYIVPSMTVGDGIFIKPGIAIFIYMALRAKHYYYEQNKYKDQNFG